MKKLLVVIAVLGLVAGCTTPVVQLAPDPMVLPCSSFAYEVTVDSWCGNGCDSYPVSHKMRDTRPENQRVELNGLRQISQCVNP
jgi:hypothetical protein